MAKEICSNCKKWYQSVDGRTRCRADKKPKGGSKVCRHPGEFEVFDRKRRHRKKEELSGTAETPGPVEKSKVHEGVPAESPRVPSREPEANIRKVGGEPETKPDAAPERCLAMTAKGTQCKNPPIEGSDCCKIPSHQKQGQSDK